MKSKLRGNIESRPPPRGDRFDERLEGETAVGRRQRRASSQEVVQTSGEELLRAPLVSGPALHERGTELDQGSQERPFGLGARLRPQPLPDGVGLPEETGVEQIATVEKRVLTARGLLPIRVALGVSFGVGRLSRLMPVRRKGTAGVAFQLGLPVALDHVVGERHQGVFVP